MVRAASACCRSAASVARRVDCCSSCSSAAQLPTQPHTHTKRAATTAISTPTHSPNPQPTTTHPQQVRSDRRLAQGRARPIDYVAKALYGLKGRSGDNEDEDEEDDVDECGFVLLRVVGSVCCLWLVGGLG